MSGTSLLDDRGTSERLAGSTFRRFFRRFFCRFFRTTSGSLARGLAPAIAFSAASLALTGPALAAPIPVTSCGQSLASDGVLTGNLDCTGLSEPGVHLQRGTRLDLNGFTLSGGDGDGVVCDDSCRVRSEVPGGTIADFAGHGVVARAVIDDKAAVAVSRVTVRDNGGHGVFADGAGGRTGANRSIISGNGGAGLYSPDKARVVASTVSGNAAQGLRAANVNLSGSEFSGNDVGVESLVIARIYACQFTDNIGDGVRATNAIKAKELESLRNGGSGLVLDTIDRLAKIVYSEISDNGLDGVTAIGEHGNLSRFKFVFIRRNGRNGITSDNFRVVVSRVDDNAFHGVYAAPGGRCAVRVDRFSIIGNGTDPSCGVSTPCADIASCAELVRFGAETKCNTSYDTASGFPGTSWGVCSAD